MTPEPGILHDSTEWLVLAKPPGWLTVPGRGTNPVVSEWAREKYGEIWTVHRLDRDTSGVLLMAHSAAAHRKAGLWFQKHEVKKNYDFLAKNSSSAPVFKVKVPVEGKPATTQFEVIESYGQKAFLGRAIPLTGRRHQIRIHLAAENHAIYGDSEYGGITSLDLSRAVVKFDRVALHARKLVLPTGEAFEAPWPEDFAKWVKELRDG